MDESYHFVFVVVVIVGVVKTTIHYPAYHYAEKRVIVFSLLLTSTDSQITKRIEQH